MPVCVCVCVCMLLLVAMFISNGQPVLSFFVNIRNCAVLLISIIMRSNNRVIRITSFTMQRHNFVDGLTHL